MCARCCACRSACSRWWSVAVARSHRSSAASPGASFSRAAEMAGLIWAAFVWCVLFWLTISAAYARGLDYWQALGLFVPVSLMWGAWCCGFLLAPRRRPSTLAVLGRISQFLQRVVRRGR